MATERPEPVELNMKCQICKNDTHAKSALSTIVHSDCLAKVCSAISAADEITSLLKQIGVAIERIVVVRGEDAGVILLSDESPTKWNVNLQADVYEHEHFSELGDALVALHRMTVMPPMAPVQMPNDQASASGSARKDK